MKYGQGKVKSYSDVTTRLQGKKGLIRYHIMGKRVNFAGRTVLSPGGDLYITELGIPRAIASKLTRPIKVNATNRAEEQANYEAGRVKYIIPRSGRHAGNRIMITVNFINENPNYRLQIGDIVERNLEDGDIVLFNRQPTLHQENIIALRIKIGDDRTFRLNLSLTTPQNADFDGDEGNIHVPQTIEAYTEAAYLFSVQNSLISGQTSRPMIGIVMNTASGAGMASTDENNPQTRSRWFQLRAAVRNFLAKVLHPKTNENDTALTQLDYLEQVSNNDHLYENRFNNLAQYYAPEIYNELQQLKVKLGVMSAEHFSQIIYRTLDSPYYLDTEPKFKTIESNEPYTLDTQSRLRISEKKDILSLRKDEQPASYYRDLKQRVEQEGQVWLSARAAVSAAFPKNFYYNNKGVKIHNGVLLDGRLSKDTLGNKNGSVVTEIVYQLGPTVGTLFLSNIQFVINAWMNDYRGFTVDIDDCFIDSEALEDEIKQIITTATFNVMKLAESNPRTDVQRYIVEQRSKAEGDVVKSHGKEIVSKYIPADNALVIMSLTGAKGDDSNISQIAALLGGVKVNGERLQQVLPGERVLPTNRVGDKNPCARGFVKNGFMKGLEPNELIAQAAAAREGITSTAISTAETGSLQHRLGKAGEDAHVQDGAVLIADGSIIEFVTGDTSIKTNAETIVVIGDESVTFWRNMQQLADRHNAIHGYTAYY
jgi:DNA-directed RNA polymerase beta' subunit